jgi:phosphatidylinositol alpha-1,6-mannosyltransferase
MGPTLAAITLDPRGGGVAAVSRLLWRVFRDEWGENCRLVTLLDDGEATASLDSSKPMRLRFGARLVRAQMIGASDWILYSHLSLAQVQTYIPAPFQRPYGIFLHGIEAWRRLSRSQRRVLEGANLLIANSKYTARRVKEAHPWIGPIAPCPLALGPDQLTSDSAAEVDRASGELGPHAVLVVARLSSEERYKGHDQLLEAWPAVQARIPDARLVFAGAGDDVARLRAKAANLRIAANVVFTGFVADDVLTSLYRTAALFAMPSRDEGFGLVYLEAMSHELPCIGSTHDAARETIEDGVSGFLVPQDDRQLLADRIVRLLSDDDLRRRMGRHGSRRARESFGYPAFRARLTSLIADPSMAVEKLASC